jgi:hypothetical protein
VIYHCRLCSLDVACVAVSVVQYEAEVIHHDDNLNLMFWYVEKSPKDSEQKSYTYVYYFCSGEFELLLNN